MTVGIPVWIGLMNPVTNTGPIGNLTATNVILILGMTVMITIEIPPGLLPVLLRHTGIQGILCLRFPPSLEA